jgi:aldose 1-epimerase
MKISFFRSSLISGGVAFLILTGCTSGVKPGPVAVSQVPKTASNAHASYNVVQREGMTLVELSTKDETDKELLSLTVAPDAGSNVISIRYKGIEILEQPKSLKDVPKQDAGIEFLYPTPNRVRDGELAYKDLKLKLKANLGKHFIHGLAREYAWSWKEPRLEGNKVVYETWLNADEKSDFYTRFPIKNRIAMTISLENEKVDFDFQVANLDQRSLPFGVGIHPYFKLNGSRAQTSVTVPVVSQMDAAELLPTGKIIPLAKTKFKNLAKGMTVEAALGADTVF